MSWMRKRLNQEEGFTLIELMVVVLIIAVLVAIAVPSFLGFRNRAQDRSAQADLRNVLLSEKAHWTDNGAYTATEADLKVFEPGIEIGVVAIGTVTSAANAGEAHVTWTAGATEDVVCMYEYSDSGNLFAVLDDATATGGTYYAFWDTATVTAKACPASGAAAGTAGWVTGGWGATTL